MWKHKKPSFGLKQMMVFFTVVCFPMSVFIARRLAGYTQRNRSGRCRRHFPAGSLRFFYAKFGHFCGSSPYQRALYARAEFVVAMTTTKLYLFVASSIHCDGSGAFRRRAHCVMQSLTIINGNAIDKRITLRASSPKL